MNFYSLAADLVVVLHAAYVGFVLLGLLAILAGIVFRWQWIRGFWFRAIHLTMIGIVVLEALFGITCPLTTWEHQLRVAAGDDVQSGSFVGRWVHDLMFYDAPPWVFTIIYCIFGGIVFAAFLLAPPRLPRFRRRAESNDTRA
jgi:hypothetical protein